MHHLPWLVQHNNDNLHLVAISNLEDIEQLVVKWWCKKYRVPERPLNEYTIEELFVEMMEDYYQNNPDIKNKFLFDMENVDKWDGSIQYDEKTKEKLDSFYKKHNVDISKWQSKENVDEKKVLDTLGMNLPDSIKKVSLLGGGEFNDSY